MAEMTEQFRYHVSNMPWFGSAAYLFCVWSLHKIMSAAERKPVNIPKAVLVLYNVAQVVLNLYVALMISGPTKGKVWGIGIPDTPAVRYGVYLHMLCKYVDFTDTLIIILRKKFVQLSFLHVYHHSTILLVWGWVVNTWPADTGSACYAYGAWVNAWVHVVMYGYYALTAVGIKPPFKSLVTMIQLTQFFSCIVHAVAALLIDSTPGIYNGVQVCYHIVMLRLFLPLLLKPKAAPAGKGAAAGGKEGVEVPATPSAASVRKQD